MRPITEAEQTKIRDTLIHADSIMTLLFYRHGNTIRFNIGEEEYRMLSDAISSVQECERLLGEHR